MSPWSVFSFTLALMLAGSVTSISPFMVEKLMALSGVTLLIDATILPFMECAITEPDTLVMVTCPFMLLASISPVMFSITIALPNLAFTLTEVCVGT